MTAPFRFLIACVQSFVILVNEKPNLIAAAGGYTSVPIVVVGFMMGVPSWIHQSDVHPIMTNRLLAPFATWITVAWEKTRRAFPVSKTIVVGNPVREGVKQGIKERAEIRFGCDPKKPTVFVFGGGTGSQWINESVGEILDELLAITNVIHVTGKGKLGGALSKPGYFVIESMMDEMPDAYAIADVVVSRAGAGAISELAALKKASIILPLPNSPQEDNAKAIHCDALVLHQQTTTPQELLNHIRRLLNDPLIRLGMGQRLGIALETDCAEKIVQMLRG
jgi:UDP-N-acetylglucosamine--N-acetylmuramyl-(pentapeptide) pyrophosphoryl-undecaprenol N-acetylglucosamine transferase